MKRTRLAPLAPGRTAPTTPQPPETWEMPGTSPRIEKSRIVFTLPSPSPPLSTVHKMTAHAVRNRPKPRWLNGVSELVPKTWDGNPSAKGRVQKPGSRPNKRKPEASAVTSHKVRSLIGIFGSWGGLGSAVSPTPSRLIVAQRRHGSHQVRDPRSIRGVQETEMDKTSTGRTHKTNNAKKAVYCIGMYR